MNDKHQTRTASRWGVSRQTLHLWYNSPKRTLRFRYEAALNGALGIYGNPTPPSEADPLNLVAIERAAVQAAGYSVGVLWDWFNNRGQKATQQQLANRVHDITQHYLRTTRTDRRKAIIKPKYLKRVAA